MRKLPLIMGAAITVCALSATATVLPGWNSVVFAANASIGTTDPATAVANLGKLMSEADAKFPEVANWSNVSSAIAVIERGNGCSGKGCLSEGALRNTIEPALTTAGTDFTNMDVFGKLTAAKAISGYDSNASLKEAVGKVETDINMWIYGDSNEPESIGVVKSLPASFNKDSLKDKTPKEIIQIVKSAPNFDKYLALGDAVRSAAQLTEAEGIDSLTQAYSKLYSAYVALGGDSSSAAPEVVTAKSELQKAVDEIKQTDEYKKAKKLVDAVRYLEGLLAMASGEPGRGGMGAAEPTQKVDQPYVAYATSARQAKAVIAASDLDPTLEKEIIDAIKAVGDAMRALGVSTDLGQNLTTINLAEAQAAFNKVQEAPKVKAYTELIDAVAEAEAAIASGATDATALKKVLETVKSAANKVLSPNTGVVMKAESDAAIHTAAILAIIATVLTTFGTAFVVRRHLARKAKSNQ